MFLPIVFLTVTACATAAETETEHLDNQQFLNVPNPEIPTSYSFAGEKVDLDRVDMAERLDRADLNGLYSRQHIADH